jgi:trk system potassium uptake protein TrkH
MIAAIHSLAIVLAVCAAAMLTTGLAGHALAEPGPANNFIVIALITGFVAGGIFFASRRPPGEARRNAKYWFVLLAWLVPPLFLAVPLLDAAGGGFFRAWLETVSGYTTTGASIFFGGVDELARTVVLWRAELHWLGGFLTLVLIVTVLAPSGLGGVPSRHVAIARRAVSGEGARHWILVRDLLVGYAGVTGAVLFGLLSTGIPVLDALCLAMSAISTGGFLPVDGGLAVYGNATAEIMLSLAMLIGATSVLWHRMVIAARWQALADHRESYWLIAAALALGVAFAVAFAAGEGLPGGTAFHRGLATGASLVSTTGMEIHPGGFAALPIPIVLLVALVGGGAFSTAGGIRFFRIGGMFAESIKETRHLIYPHGIRPKLFGAPEFDVGIMKAIWSLFSATLAFLAAVTLIVTLAGIDFGGALAATVAAFSNVGGVFASGWAEAADWPSFAEMPAAIQLLMAAVMIVGRLEIIAIIVVVSLMVWRA